MARSKRFAASKRSIVSTESLAHIEISVYTECVRFTYGQPRRQANTAKHAIDLAEFEAAFSFDRFLTITTKPSRTKRQRFKLIGSWCGEIVVVAIVSPLGSEAIDVVSVRPANAKEKASYAEG